MKKTKRALNSNYYYMYLELFDLNTPCLNEWSYTDNIFSDCKSVFMHGCLKISKYV